MGLEFSHKAYSTTRDLTKAYNMSILGMNESLDPYDVSRLEDIRRAWNYYEGYHWEDIPQTDKPQITENYCRAFVNKFVSFELGKGFTIDVDPKNLEVYKPENGEEDAGTLKQSHLDFLNDVWKTSKKDSLCIELAQSKAITGDAWLQIKFYAPSEFDDDFGEYPNGKILVKVIPTNVVFPQYNDKDNTLLEKVVIAYPIKKVTNVGMLKRTKTENIMYKQIWTRDSVEVYEGDTLVETFNNKYKLIPFVQIKNYPVAGRSFGVSDLEDLIPLNTELNLKKSDVSEILDYHSAPVTVIFGARTQNLERGANKIWGGLPKDAKVQNLELQSDLTAANNYINDVKSAMHDIGGVPKGALGGEQAISNTSGVALQFVNMPLIERTAIKRTETSYGLVLANKIILKVGVTEDLITIPETMTPKDFYDNEVNIPDNLPKDELIELQKVETKMRLGIESKQGAAKSTGNSNFSRTQSEIDSEKQKDFEFAQKFNIAPNNDPNNKNADGEPKQINSGLTNGTTNTELVRKEITGQNGGNNQ